MKAIKKFFKKTPLYTPLRKLYRRAKGTPTHPLQSVRSKKGLNIIRLGSENCGWSFLDNSTLYGCTIISAGLGEDGSFDIEFAQKYDARVIVVDPTPRAIQHYKEITLNLGKHRSQSYSSGGKQPIEAYELSELTAQNFILVEKALWNKSTRLRFFEPANSKHVSHSIVNFQHSYRMDTPFIEVEATTLSELLIDLDIQAAQIELIKLDIEGAEIEVLIHAMSNGIRPRQILVEYDELNFPTSKGFERIDEAHAILCQNNYELLRTDGQADFLYLRKDT